MNSKEKNAGKKSSGDSVRKHRAPSIYSLRDAAITQIYETDDEHISNVR